MGSACERWCLHAFLQTPAQRVGLSSTETGSGSSICAAQAPGTARVLLVTCGGRPLPQPARPARAARLAAMADEYDPHALDVDEQEEDAAAEWEATRQRLVVLVDADVSMLQPLEHDGRSQSCLAWAVEVVERQLRARIRRSPNDEVALVFYSTVKRSEPAAADGSRPFDHVYADVALDAADAATIRRLAAFSGAAFQQSPGCDDVRQLPGRTADDLRSGLFAAWDLLQKPGGGSRVSKSVLVVTANADPLSGAGANAEHLREQLHTRAAELGSLAAHLDVLPLVPTQQQQAAANGSGSSFDYSLFWRGLLAQCREAVAGVTGSLASEAADVAGDMDEAEDDPAFKLDDWLDDSKAGAARKRPLGRLTWQLGPGCKIGAQLFALVQPAKRPNHVYITADTHQPVTRSTALIDADTGAMLPGTTMRSFNPCKAGSGASAAAAPAHTQLLEPPPQPAAAAAAPAVAGAPAAAAAAAAAAAGDAPAPAAAAPAAAAPPAAAAAPAAPAAAAAPAAPAAAAPPAAPAAPAAAAPAPAAVSPGQERRAPPRQGFPQVVLSGAEVRRLKALRPKGLVLLGFKPLACLAQHHQLVPSRFVYPDERGLKGSTAAFAALHAACLKEDVVAVCRYVRQTASMPFLAALVPQPEEVDEDDRQLVPSGFHLITLPYADNLRNVEREPKLVAKVADAAGLPPRASDEQVAAAEALIEAISLGTDDAPFRSDDIANPHLERHFSVLEALALDQPVVSLEEFVDDTEPDEAGIDANMHLLKAFNLALYGDESGPGVKVKAGVKRKAEQAASVADEYSQHDWARLMANGGLKQLTIPALKVYLKFHSLPVSGNKTQLMARIEERERGGML